MNSASDCQVAPYKDTNFLIIAIYTSFSIIYRYLWIDVIPPAVAHEGDIVVRVDMRRLLDQIHDRRILDIDLEAVGEPVPEIEKTGDHGDLDYLRFVVVFF